MTARIGTAGWSIPRQAARAFSQEGTALERYASQFSAVEINSSFHRPHRQSTWAQWAEVVPPAFRFSVKLPKEITHRRKLIDCGEPLAKFVDDVGGLGPKLAVLLVQLPPSLVFERAIAANFFDLLAAAAPVQTVCEPRHASWFEAVADSFLAERQIIRAAADPAPVAAAAQPGGWREASYWRLHDSPQMYRSAYGEDRLQAYAERLRREPAAWCMFDNTASSAAIDDALRLKTILRSHD